MNNYDRYHRSINYLRVSITDRCNLRCVYCMPEAGVPQCSHGDILSYEEIELVVRAAVGLGVTKVRLTGGEPLVRLGIVELVRALAAIPGLDDLAMTTNGMLLSTYAGPLADAGLKRVNVSLDTLRPERFQQITRWGRLGDVLAGLAAAQDAGLQPIKINTVVIRGLNDDEVVDQVRWATTAGWQLRFIEWMPLGHEPAQAGSWPEHFVGAEEIQAALERAMGQLTPVEGGSGGPAQLYRLPEGAGTVGFIAAISHRFCSTCNRLRLTADGQLRPCLLSDREIDLRTPLREGADQAQIQALLREAMLAKPRHHLLDEDERAEARAMAQIGG